MEKEVQIRIGCETHTVDYWDVYKDDLARKHNEIEWWNNYGKPIYEFLKDERERYLKFYGQSK